MGMTRRQFLQGGALAATGVALSGTPGEANADAPVTRIKGLKASTTICPYCAVGCGLLVVDGDRHHWLLTMKASAGDRPFATSVGKASFATLIMLTPT